MPPILEYLSCKEAKCEHKDKNFPPVPKKENIGSVCSDLISILSAVTRHVKEVL